MKHPLARPQTMATVLTRLIESPDVVRTVRALPAPAFSALVRHVGVEDAGELVALATTEQLLAAFDEELFANERPGQRERFDAERFAVWLEVLLEAGDEVAANRVAELSEDFVTQALSTLVLVLDHDALQARMSEQGNQVARADKALDSALGEELEGYLLLARRYEGWDAALSLILALDRDHHALLSRILDRLAAMASEYLDDLDALSELLSAEQSLEEDVEAEREDRRTRHGYVEPRAARSFLELARRPAEAGSPAGARDPITRAYFREVERSTAVAPDVVPAARELAWLDELARSTPAALPRAAATSDDQPGLSTPLGDALRTLSSTEPRIFDARMEELAYLANVLIAGAELDGRRFRPSEAAEAALATVAWGAELAARDRRGPKGGAGSRACADELGAVLRSEPADRLFRRASAALAAGRAPQADPAFLRSRAELEALLGQSKRPSAQRKQRPAAGAARPRGKRPSAKPRR